MKTLTLLLFMVMVQPMSVDTLINDIIVTEGGYVNHPADRGGPTKYGITQKTLASYRRMPVSAKEVQNMSRQEAYDIYKKIYFDTYGVDKLPETIHDLVLDMNVHHGPGNTNKLLQKAINRFGIKLQVDGVAGSKTIEAAKQVNPVALRYILAREREAFMRDIVKKDPSQQVFLNGWLNRVEKFVNT